jgi:hypothetical protein
MCGGEGQAEAADYLYVRQVVAHYICNWLTRLPVVTRDQIVKVLFDSVHKSINTQSFDSIESVLINELSHTTFFPTNL